MPIDSKTRDLGIKIRKVPSLKQGVVTEANTWHDVAGAESYLFDLGEIFVDHAVKDELPNRLQRHELFRPDFGRVENVEVKFVFILLFNHLDCEGPLGEGAVLDSFFEIFAMEIWANTMSFSLQEILNFRRTWVLPGKL